MTNLMMSLITPAHVYNNYLDELYESILAQTYTNWEWVILLNGTFTADQVPKSIAADNRVKIYADYSGNSRIGYLKNIAFSKGIGDILVELDYDDMITPDCLEELNNAFQQKDIGFVYSDDAILMSNGKFIPYNPLYGWKYRMFEWNGEELYSMTHFLPSSHALSFIYYAPDHVRAWRKDVYVNLGGHNVELSVCDDHELLIRSYLSTNFLKIDKILYIYRKTGNNTVITRNAEIQTSTRELFKKYSWALATHDTEKQGLLKIDLAPKNKAVVGYKSIEELCEPDSYVLNGKLPLPDNSVGVLNASHILQKIEDKSLIMSEIHRVLAHGGWAFIEVPSTDGRGAFQDPTHVSYWNENSFLYYTDKKYGDYIENTQVKFSSFLIETISWDREIKVVRTVLCAIKEGGERFPGPYAI
jgi:glycosyltransferase involved in cell wall biosynthesis